MTVVLWVNHSKPEQDEVEEKVASIYIVPVALKMLLKSCSLHLQDFNSVKHDLSDDADDIQGPDNSVIFTEEEHLTQEGHKEAKAIQHKLVVSDPSVFKEKRIDAVPDLILLLNVFLIYFVDYLEEFC